MTTDKRIALTSDVYGALIDYKNKKAFYNKKSKYSFNDAVRDLLKESKTLAEWMKGKQ